MSGFIHLRLCRVARGAYPKELLEAWAEYDRKQGSENDCPAALPADQLYMVVVCEHGGTDLEKHAALSFAQAKSMLCQVRACIHLDGRVIICHALEE